MSNCTRKENGVSSSGIKQYPTAIERKSDENMSENSQTSGWAIDRRNSNAAGIYVCYFNSNVKCM